MSESEQPNGREFNFPKELHPAYKEISAKLAALVEEGEDEFLEGDHLAKAEATTVMVHMLLRHAALNAVLVRRVFIGGEPDKRLWNAACTQALDGVLRDLDGMFEESGDAQD